MQFVRINPDGSASSAGWAPHLDLEPIASGEGELPDLHEINRGLTSPDRQLFDFANVEQKAIAYAAAKLVP